jgi:hypothetical protein
MLLRKRGGRWEIGATKLLFGGVARFRKNIGRRIVMPEDPDLLGDLEKPVPWSLSSCSPIANRRCLLAGSKSW